GAAVQDLRAAGAGRSAVGPLGARVAARPRQRRLGAAARLTLAHDPRAVVPRIEERDLLGPPRGVLGPEGGEPVARVVGVAADERQPLLLRRPWRRADVDPNIPTNHRGCGSTFRSSSANMLHTLSVFRRSDAY